MPLTFGRDILNEGQFAQVVCIVTEGDEPLKISWSLQGETVSSEAGLSTTSLGTRTSMLTIQSVGYRHSGSYTCTAANSAGTRSESVQLRVNGTYKILFYKRKRSQQRRPFNVIYFVDLTSCLSNISNVCKLASENLVFI